MCKNILEKDIEKQIAKERYTVPKETKKKNHIAFHLILAISILLGLIASAIRLLT